MILRKERKVIIITGKSGTGKTKLSREIIKLFRRKIILDILDEYTDGIVFYSMKDFVNNVSVIDENINIILRSFREKDINDVCEWCLIAGNVLLTIEEFENYVSRYDSFPKLDEIIRRGRHNDVSLLAVSQRVPDFPPLFRSQITSFFSFFQDEPIDIKHLLSRGFILEDIEELERCEGLNLPIENKHYLCQGENYIQIMEWINHGKQKNILRQNTEAFQI